MKENKHEPGSPSSEVRKAEQEVELSNRKLSHALDLLKLRTDTTAAAFQRFRLRLSRVKHPVELASEKASRSRAFAWTGLGAVGLLTGFGVKKVFGRSKTR